MTFRNVLLASCALVISATAATAQIPSYVPTEGLVGWWPFNGNANDESGNGNDGVVNQGSNGSITYTTDRDGAPAAALSFSSNPVWNSLGPYIEVINSTDLLVNSSFTINYYVFVLGTNETGELINKGPDNIPGAFVSVVYGLTLGNAITGSAIVSSNDFSLGNWRMVTISFDNSSTLSLFINGVLVESASSLPITNNSSSFFFGAMPSGGSNGSYYPFQGYLDDIGFWNRALAPQEIQNLYNGTTETVDTGNGAAPLPQGIPYQAAARDAQGQVIADSPVIMRFTLHEGAADGAASYAETHALTTNSLGLFNTVFGNGTPEQSAFDSINWAATTKFLQVEIDLGEGYVDMGTTQLLSVPYALRSAEAARVKNAGLPIFSNNATALAGGLVAGEMYRTAAGVLMVAY
jgi:hypothetical protein